MSLTTISEYWVCFPFIFHGLRRKIILTTLIAGIDQKRHLLSSYMTDHFLRLFFIHTQDQLRAFDGTLPHVCPDPGTDGSLHTGLQVDRTP